MIRHSLPAILALLPGCAEPPHAQHVYGSIVVRTANPERAEVQPRGGSGQASGAVESGK